MTKRPKKTSASSSVDDDVRGWLASTGMDKQADYITRGRSHKDLPEQELTERWVQAFKRMAADPRNYELRAVHTDLNLEFEVRGKKPPYASVREDFDRYQSAGLALVKELENDPDRYEEFGRGLVAEIEAFKTTRDKTKS